MNTTKLVIAAVSVLLAASTASAWSKKSENTGNLGRMYVSIDGGGAFSKAKSSGTVATGASSSTTGAQAAIVFNAPVFKPGVNAFRDISWAGLDTQIFFNYSYTGEYDFGEELTSLSSNTQTVGAALVPYLNFETGWSFFKAVKPFARGYVGYTWQNDDGQLTADDAKQSDHFSYFTYGVGAGVEFVLLDEISVTPMWQWNGNAQDGLADYQTVGIEATYWINEMFCVSAFWNHDFGSDRDGIMLGESEFGSINKVHGDTIGLKFKLGFKR